MLYNYSKFINEKYTKKELNPTFWSKDLKFDYKVRQKLINIANDFYESLNIDIPIIDIKLTGSMANFNYTKDSDLDVHIILNFDDYDNDKDTLDSLLKMKAFVWNIKHDITIRGSDVELYVENENEEHISTGLFSLKNNEWIKKPKYTDPDVDESDINSKFEKWVYEIEELEKLVDDENISNEDNIEYHKRSEKLKDKLRKFRKKGLHEGSGEFSVENLTFKKLRNEGYIKKLYDINTKFYDLIYSQ